MRIRYFLAILIALSIFISSCDEINKIFNPSSDEYLIDKTISVSTTEQVVESGTEFKMIFPANSVNGDITLKIKKEGSSPTFNIPNTKLGSNTYRIKFEGNTGFSSPVKVIINYDKSQIPAGKTAAEIIQAYIYANGNWKLTTYQLDETNSKIIISILSIIGKINKDEPILLDDGEIIIGDSYTTTDTGQSDNPLARYNFFSFHLISNIVFDDGDSDDDVQWEYEYYTNCPALKWNGNDFSFTREVIEPKDWITEYVTEPDSTIVVGYGTVAADGEKLVKFTYDYYNVSRTYYGPDRQPDLKIILKSFTLENLKIYLPDLQQFPDAYPYEEITGTEIANYITKFNCRYYFYTWDIVDHEANITDRKSVSYNWNGSYSRLGISFLKLENVK